MQSVSVSEGAKELPVGHVMWNGTPVMMMDYFQPSPEPP